MWLSFASLAVQWLVAEGDREPSLVFGGHAKDLLDLLDKILLLTRLQVTGVNLEENKKHMVNNVPNVTEYTKLTSFLKIALVSSNLLLN